MSNDPDREVLLQQIKNLLGAVQALQGCLESPEASLADGSFAAARAQLRGAADEAGLVVNSQRAAQEGKPASSTKITAASSLQAGAEAAEWKASKLKAEGDEVGALQSCEHAATLRRMAAEASVTERRQSFHLVPTGKDGDKSPPD